MGSNPHYLVSEHTCILLREAAIGLRCFICTQNDSQCHRHRLVHPQMNHIHQILQSARDIEECLNCNVVRKEITHAIKHAASLHSLINSVCHIHTSNATETLEKLHSFGCISITNELNACSIILDMPH